MQNAPASDFGWDLWSGCQALTLRHEASDSTARRAVEALGLPWPKSPGQFVGLGPWLARLHPQEVLAVIPQSGEPALAQTLLSSLAPGHFDAAVCVDLSEALALIELHGPGLDGWLARLVDASAIPWQVGCFSRCRLADVAVMLLRLAPHRVLLAVDRPLAPYIEDWLAYTLDAMRPASPP